MNEVRSADAAGSASAPRARSQAAGAGRAARDADDQAREREDRAAGAPAPSLRRLIRIVVVEDHAVVREGTAELLERDPDLTVIGQAGSAEEALPLICELRPEIALVDVELPGMNGIALARTLAQQAPEVRVLILSAYSDFAYVIEALETGVTGYLLKTASAREVCNAVHTSADGALVLDDAISRRLTRRWRSEASGPATALTVRETEVLQLIARGLSNRQIADQLGLGLRTVESHVSNLLGKLDLASRTEAALYAVSHHLGSAGPSGTHRTPG